MTLKKCDIGRAGANPVEWGVVTCPSGGWPRGCAAPILLPILSDEGMDMSDQAPNPLTQWSDALAALVAGSAGLVASIHTPHHRPRSGTLWRPDVVIGSEQVFPKADTAEIVVADGRRVTARLAGRDRGTNIVALRLETPIEVAAPAAAEPQLGGLAVALGAAPRGAAPVRPGTLGGVVAA